MDWNTTGPNRVELPSGVTVHDVGVFPVVELLKPDLAKTRPCPVCKRLVSQMLLKPRLETGSAIRLRYKEGGVQGVIDIDGSLLTIREDLRITGVEVWYRRRDDFVLEHGTKAADAKAADANDPYQRSTWEKAKAFTLPGRREAADAELLAHNAWLVEEHARWSDHPGHADAVLEVTDG